MQLAPGTVKRYLSNAVHRLEAHLGPMTAADGDDEDAADQAATVVSLRAGGSRS